MSGFFLVSALSSNGGRVSGVGLAGGLLSINNNSSLLLTNLGLDDRTLHVILLLQVGNWFVFI